MPRTQIQSGGDDVSAVIVDPGFDTLRIGNCQEDYPRELLPSALYRIAWTREEASNWTPLSPLKRSSFSEVRNLLQLNRDENLEVEPFVFEKLVRLGVEGHPLERDEFSDLDDNGCVRKVGGLGLDITQHPMLVTEPTSESKQFRDATLEVLFEQLDVPAAYLAKRASLTAFSVGRASALVVDIGAGGCTVSPVHDGISLQSTIQTSLVGGNALDIQLANYLYDDGYKFFMPKENASDEYYKLRVARQLRESFCTLAQTDSPDEVTSYRLPDGELLSMDKYATALPELLFSPGPSTISEFNQFKGLTTMITDCIFDSDVEIRRELLSSIVVAGGCSLIPGLIDRISSDLHENATLAATKFKLVHSSSYMEKRFSTWLGASILASLGRFQQLWISKAEYQEHGTTIAYRRCH